MPDAGSCALDICPWVTNCMVHTPGTVSQYSKTCIFLGLASPCRLAPTVRTVPIHTLCSIGIPWACTVLLHYRCADRCLSLGTLTKPTPGGMSNLKAIGRARIICFLSSFFVRFELPFRSSLVYIEAQDKNRSAGVRDLVHGRDLLGLG